MNPAALPETPDFGGPVGQIFDRQAQVRWTQSFAPSGWTSGGHWSDAGIEYIYADRETENGLKGHLNRLQASAKYAF